MKFPVSLSGLENVQARIERLTDTSRIEDALDKGAALVEKSALARMPRDTGEMASKMYVESPAKLERVVGNTARQAVFTEYSQRLLRGATPQQPREGPWPYKTGSTTKGTKARASMPWLRPALRENAERIRRLLREALEGTRR